ncbi:MAG: carbohydrate-binding domain-containing protein, partial [Candidatus Omnitrophota bacterium]
AKQHNFSLLQTITPQVLENQEKLYSFIKDFCLWQYRQDQYDRVDYFMKKEEPIVFLRKKYEKAMLVETLKQKARIEANAERNYISNENWQGLSIDGNRSFENGNMYWSGTMFSPLLINVKKASFIITARATAANDIWPYMIVELDNNIVWEGVVDSEQFREYSFESEAVEGLSILSITYENDGQNKKMLEDRNLYVKDVRVEAIE